MWFPLLNYTHYSLLRGFSKPRDLLEKCVSSGYKACGLSDYKTLSGAVAFYKECVKHGVKPIIGCAFDDFFLFAKNKQGWFELIKIVSSIEDEQPSFELINKFVHKPAKKNLILLSENVDGDSDDVYSLKYVPMPSFYAKPEDAKLHRILLASKMKTTIPKIQQKLSKNEEFEDSDFFKHEEYYIRDKDEQEFLTHEYRAEIENTLESIYNKCEEYDILNKPILPRFPTPNNQSEKEYLKDLCRQGWVDTLIKQGKVKDSVKKDEYHKRFEYEFEVIESANLYGYFLIVQDILKYVRSNGWIPGPGRGSAAGCLISYLLGITEVDPIEYDLLFERFFDPSRLDSLPDIDIDIPSDKRDEIIDYVNNKYGRDNVSQMITFGRLQGRSALKEVLRINDVCGYGLMNEITSHFPNESDISDQLQEMDEEDRSIIRWSLINRADQLRDYCYIDSDGNLHGDYAEYFQQAIDLEGTFKTQGKHAAGVVISKDPLHDVCPMVNQRSGGEKIAGLEMEDLEALGQVKLDLLGLSYLDKVMMIEEQIAKKQ